MPPLCPSLLSYRIGTEPLAELHLQTRGEADDSNQTLDPGFGGQPASRRSDAPAGMPVAKRLFKGHALGILVPTAIALQVLGNPRSCIR
jgi:hypothetical protein